MSLSREAYQAIYDALLEHGDHPDAEATVTNTISRNFDGNPRSIQLSFRFFYRCRNKKPHRIGLPLAIVRVALEKAFESDDPEIIASTIFCIEDYVEWSKKAHNAPRPAIRSVLSEFKVRNKSILLNVSLDQLLDSEARDAVEAAKLDTEKLKSLAINAPSGPAPRVRVTSEVRRRNPYVREFVLRQANGRCQRCKRPAPFKQKDSGRPFLEVHHRIPLSEGGDDTIENTVALCPNCHREAHHGENWKKFRP